MNEKVAGLSVPSCLTVHDLSLMGRCALSVAIPVLAALGVQAVPLPTALYSNHLGFAHHYMLPLDKEIPKFVKAWEVNGVHFDAFYSGFLANPEQIRLVHNLIQRYTHPGDLIMIDPAMADRGKMYSAFDHTMVQAMRNLLRDATITTPNYTESCFVCDVPYHAGQVSKEEARRLASELVKLGPETVVITSLPVKKGYLANYLYDQNTHTEAWFTFAEIPLPAVGTGDLFASALVGLRLKGVPWAGAVQVAGQFVTNGIKRLQDAGTKIENGVPFELELPYLWQEGEKYAK